MEVGWLDETRWEDIHTFRYPAWRFDPSTGVAEFDFVHEGSDQRVGFTDVIQFPLPRDGVAPGALDAVRPVLELLYVAVGTVYYKGIAPKDVSVDAVSLAPAARRWAEQLYRRGLAEFAHRWTLTHVLELPVRSAPRAPATELHDVATPDRPPLVAIGGGKDSLVALEALHGAREPRPATFAVEREPTPLLEEIMAAGPGPGLLIRRRQDPALTEMLRDNVLRVGHVPVAAILSLAGVAAAVLHDLGPVVMANERSADAGNLTWQGHEVNHQWSKSTEAERLLDDALREHAGIAHGCFSLLRGMSELAICGLFAATTGYDDLVTSCNFAFRLSGQGRTERWCADCAKCRFVFLSLAVFMDRPRLVGIFGRDLLDDPAQLEGFRELLGLSGHKPFECVGEIAETRVALGMLAEQPTWQRTAVVEQLAPLLPPTPPEAADEVWRIDPAPMAPAVYQAALDHWAPVGSGAAHGGS